MFASLTNTKVVSVTTISTNIETAMLSNLNCNDDFDGNDDYAGQVESEHLKLCEEEKGGGEGGSHDQGHQRKADRLERRELTTCLLSLLPCT